MLTLAIRSFPVDDLVLVVFFLRLKLGLKGVGRASGGRVECSSSVSYDLDLPVPDLGGSTGRVVRPIKDV